MKQYRELRRQLRVERLGLTTRRSAAELAVQAFSLDARAEEEVFGKFRELAERTDRHPDQPQAIHSQDRGQDILPHARQDCRKRHT